MLPAVKEGVRQPTVEIEKDVWDALEWDGYANHNPSSLLQGAHVHIALLQETAPQGPRPQVRSRSLHVRFVSFIVIAHVLVNQFIVYSLIGPFSSSRIDRPGEFCRARCGSAANNKISGPLVISDVVSCG